MEVRGVTAHGNNKFERRMRDYPEVFAKYTRMNNLHPGTLNVKTDEYIAIWPHFIIPGSEADDPKQDLLFEQCTLIFEGERHDGFRVRPYHRPTGCGGNGDNHLEIVAPTIPGAETKGRDIRLEFDRSDRR